MSALKTTTQLLLVVLSNRVSASWGTFTFISLVQWIKSENTHGAHVRATHITDLHLEWFKDPAQDVSINTAWTQT